MALNQESVTQLLHDARSGNQSALEKVYPVVYDELRRIAHQRLSKHRPGKTLNTTALVHEAYIKLVDQTRAQWNDRAHFFALASRAMRFILIDYARRRTAAKRGGPEANIPLSAVQVAAEERTADLLALDEALNTLAEANERLSQLVEYRFFGGLTYEEIAEVTEWSVPTIKRDWRRARAWLYRAMQETQTKEDS